MSLKDQKNLFCEDADITGSGDIGDVIKLGAPVDINKNNIMRVKGIINESLAGGTGAGYLIEVKGAGADGTYDVVLASKTYADGSEPVAGDEFNLILQEAEAIQFFKIVGTRTTGDYATGQLTAFFTHD